MHCVRCQPHARRYLAAVATLDVSLQPCGVDHTGLAPVTCVLLTISAGFLPELPNLTLHMCFCADMYTASGF